MKLMLVLGIVIAFVAITEGSVQLPYSKANLEFFAKVKFEQLPRDLQISIKKSVREGDSSNWCCVNNRPIKSVQKTKTVINNVKVTTQVKVGYTKCSFMGMTMCPTYDVKYTTKSESHIEYFEVLDHSTCPELDARCCENFVPLAGNCVDLATMSKYAEVLLELKKDGVLVG